MQLELLGKAEIFDDGGNYMGSIMTDRDRKSICEASNLRCGKAAKLEIYKDLEFELEKLLDFKETRIKENKTIQ